MTEPAPPKRRFQFTLVALLVLMLAVAGGLSGYKFGFNQGHARGQSERESEAPVVKVYAVADLISRRDANPSVAPSDDYDSLIEAITQTIAPEEWTDAGGIGSIESMPTNRSLIIRQLPEVHDQIADLLTQLRAVNNK